MFRMYYELRIRNPYKELYNPTSIYKVYNYIKCNNIDIESVNVGQTIWINSSLQQTILHKTNTGFFVYPGIYMPDFLYQKTNTYTININEDNYNLTFDVFNDQIDQLIVGSIVLPEQCKLFNIHDHCRIVDMSSNNIVYMNYIDIINILNLTGMYLHNQTTTILYFNHNPQILNWLNKANNLAIHSLTTPHKDIDISLYIRCYGGSPTFSLTDSLPKYNLTLTNLTTGETVSKDMPQFYCEKLNSKDLYELNITDSLMSQPLMVNNIANNGSPIIINLNSVNEYKINNLNSKSNVLQKFSEVYQPLIR